MVIEKYPCESLCWLIGASLTRLVGLNTRSCLHSSLSTSYSVNTSLVVCETLEQIGTRPNIVTDCPQKIIRPAGQPLSPVKVTVSWQGETWGLQS